MPRLALLPLLFGISTAAHATPKNAFGVGVGFPDMLHLDYQQWIKPKTSIEVNLTPLVMLNIATVGLNHHIPLSASATQDHNLLISGNVMTLVGMMDGSPAFGVGGRVGYEWFLKHVGFSVAGGPTLLQTTGGPTRLESLVGGRLTLWFLKRDAPAEASEPSP